MSRSRSLWLVALGLALGTGVTLWVRGSRSPAQGPRVRFLTEGKENLERFAVSPDGRQVVVPSTRGGGWNLWRYDLGSGAWTQLTRGEGTDLAPVFVENGRAIVFHSARNARSALYRVDANGGEPTLIIDAPRSVYRALTAFDDHTVLYGTEREIVSLDLRNRSTRTLVHLDEAYGFRNISVSPDRHKLLLGVRRSPAGAVGGTKSDLWLHDLSSNQGRWVTEDGQSNAEGDFLSDYTIVYSSARGGRQNLWTLILDGRPPVQITQGPGDDDYPSVLPDGRILFAEDKTVSRLFQFKSGWRALGGEEFEQWDPSLDREGRRLVFTAFDRDTDTRLLWSADGPEFARPRPLGSSLRALNPVQSSDGREIVATLMVAERPVLSLLGRNGALERTVAAGRPCGSGSVSSDGRRIAFAPDSGGLMIAPHDGGEPERVLDGDVCAPRFSPVDPNLLACLRKSKSGKGQLELLDLRTRTPRPLFETSVRGSSMAWDPSGRAIYLIRDGQRQIYRVSLADGQSSVVAEAPGDEVTDVAAGPDGLVVAQVWTGRTRLAVLENLR